MSNSTHSIVVFELRSRWEPELQRQFLDEPVRVRGCRRWSELTSLTHSSVGSDANSSTRSESPRLDLVVIDLPESAVDCLQWLNRLIAAPCTPSIVVLCPSAAANLEWPLREAGAREVLVGDVSGEHVARCCRSLLRLK